MKAECPTDYLDVEHVGCLKNSFGANSFPKPPLAKHGELFRGDLNDPEGLRLAGKPFLENKF